MRAPRGGRRGRERFALCSALTQCGEFDHALALGTMALETARSAGNPMVIADKALLLAQAHAIGGDPRISLTLAREAATLRRDGALCRSDAAGDGGSAPGARRFRAGVNLRRRGHAVRVSACHGTLRRNGCADCRRRLRCARYDVAGPRAGRPCALHSVDARASALAGARAMPRHSASASAVRRCGSRKRCATRCALPTLRRSWRREDWYNRSQLKRLHLRLDGARRTP